MNSLRHPDEGIRENYGVYADIRSTELHRVIDQIEWIISGKANTTVREIVDDGVKLSVNDTVDTVRDMVEKLGYDLSDEDIRAFMRNSAVSRARRASASRSSTRSSPPPRCRFPRPILSKTM